MEPVKLSAGGASGLAGQRGGAEATRFKPTLKAPGYCRVSVS